MNTIPLVKGNTQEEINTSLIALKKALDEMNSSSSKTDASVQSQIKQINELITNINSHLDTIDGQITDLQPVDSVTSGNMQSVTSNAVANLLDIYIIKVNYTITADSAYVATYNADTSEYKTILAVIESTGDNKVIPFRCEYNNGSVSIGLQNFNAVDLTLPIKIRLLRKHI